MNNYQPGPGRGERTGPIEYDDGRNQIQIGGRVGGKAVVDGREINPEQYRTGAARPGPVQPPPGQRGPAPQRGPAAPSGPASWPAPAGPPAPAARSGPMAGPAGGQPRQAGHTGDLVVGSNVVNGTQYGGAPYGWDPNNPNLDVDRAGPQTFGGDVSVRTSDGPAGRSVEVHAPQVTGDLVVGSRNVVGGRAQTDPNSSRSYADRTRNGGPPGPGTGLHKG